MNDAAPIVARLRSQTSQGSVVLFLGAGFSRAASDAQGKQLPSSGDLARECWRIAFPDMAFDETTQLGDVFYAAKLRNPSTLLSLIRSRLRVDSHSLPEFYLLWFSFPWARCYTLNIDDLEDAVSRRFSLPRTVRPISATTDMHSESAIDALEVIHLNGTIGNTLDEMTFSDADYGARLARPEKWHYNCATDILSRPVVFVGTTLNESTLWQYMQYRKTRSPRGTHELRPGSYLVTPTLSQPRQLLLKELNIDWVAMTAQEFAESVLTDLQAAAAEGHRQLQAKLRSELRRSRPQLISEIASLPTTAETEYLLGGEPGWTDLAEGRAIVRDVDADIHAHATSVLSAKSISPPLVITGTAGSGKSTSLMRLGLRLSAEGIPTYWIDEESNIEPHQLRKVVFDSDAPVAILVDDADLWGNVLTGWARELPSLRPGVLFAAATRASKFEGLLDPDSLSGVQPYEISMPYLMDSEIEALISVLDSNNRLGVLKGKSHEERVRAFQAEAGRQLIVAMIQATSGRKFREKVFEEFSELTGPQRLAYAIICLTSSQRFTIDRDELLLATGAYDNEMLNAIEALARRHIIVRQTIHLGYKARHRVIADEVVQGMQERGMAALALEGLCFAFANRIRQHMPRTARPWRRLIRFINHDFLMKVAGTDAARQIYMRLESLLQ